MKTTILFSLLVLSSFAQAGMYEQDCLLALGKAADLREAKACKQIDTELGLDCVRHYGISSSVGVIEACAKITSTADLACATAPGAYLDTCVGI